MIRLDRRAWGLGLSLGWLAVSACVTEPADDAGDGGTETSTTAEGTTAEGTTAGGTTADTSATATDGASESGEPVEETHVVLTECVEQSCEPMTVVVEVMPESALLCAQDLYDNGLPGLVTLLWQAGGGSGEPPYQEEALLILADGRVVRQQRQRDGGAWMAWGPHMICNVSSGYFAPEANIVECMEVADWTCDEVQAAVMP